MTLRVVLSDDHALVRSGIRSLLEGAGIEVVGEAAGAEEVLTLVTELRPDIVLLDVAMRGRSGIEAARELSQLSPGVRIVMLSMHAEPEYVRESAAAGASGYVLKEALFNDLLEAIEVVMKGGSHFPDGQGEAPASAPLSASPARREIDKLTVRERQVLGLIAEGKSSVEIGRSLLISPRTADTHRKNIMDKLGIHSIAGLTRFAIRYGLCPLDAETQTP